VTERPPTPQGDPDGDRPAEPADLAPHLDRLREQLLRPPGAQARWDHLAAMRRARAETARPVRRPARALVIAAAAGVAVLGATGGLAAAGSLPGPIQDTAARVAGAVGVSLPRASDHGDSPGDHGPPASTPPASATEGPADPPGLGRPTDPPGLTGEGPGRSSEAPGRTGETPGPGHGTPTPTTPAAPGGGGEAPGRSSEAPGQTGTTPGQSGGTPSEGAEPPGRAGTAPGLAGTVPGPAAPAAPAGPPAGPANGGTASG
jgi:hypothetical protein